MQEAVRNLQSDKAHLEEHREVEAGHSGDTQLLLCIASDTIRGLRKALW